MSVVRVHPEQLIDRLARGELSGPDRQLLDEHLDECPACRLELQLRRDFEFEEETLRVDDFSGSVGGVLARVEPRVAPGAGKRTRKRTRRHRILGMAAGVVVALAASAAAAKSGAVARAWSAARAVVVAVVASPGRSAEPAAVAGRHSTQSAATGQQASEQVAAKPSAEPPPVPSSWRAEPLPAALPRANALAGTAPAAAARGAGSATTGTGESPSALFERAGAARRAGSQDAIALYERLVREHPQSPEASLARAVVARLQLDHGDVASALRGFDAYLKGGAGALGEDALAGRAMALGRLGRVGDERQAWTELLARFPRSSYAPTARQRLGATTAAPPSRAGAGAPDDPL